MLTRELTEPTYSAGCAGAPPPLHIHPNTLGAAWFPPVRPDLPDTPGQPFFVGQPIVAPFGDDPTDPAMQENPHRHTHGMVARFNVGPSAQRGPVVP